MSSTKHPSHAAGSTKSATNLDLEKALADTEQIDEDLDHIGEVEGYVLDAQAGNASLRHLKTTKDGSTILIPQPSSDPNDPLNWSQTKKNLILAVVSCTGMCPLLFQLKRIESLILLLAAFLPDYGSATGAVTLIPQAS
jgi:hypothetical protein